MKRFPILLTLLFTSLSMGMTTEADWLTVYDQREELIATFHKESEGAIPALVEAVQSESPLISRTAAHLLVRLGPPSEEGLRQALEHPDFRVRRIAIHGLAGMGKLKAHGQKILNDPHPSIRREVELVFLSEERFTLPTEDWKFRIDPGDEGRDSEWFTADFDDGAWEEHPIETTWSEFLEETGYVGVAWYRRLVGVPAFDDDSEVFLQFESVDESTWVWINGEFVGEHDHGVSGWNKPFEFEVSDYLKSGEENLIVVRVLATAGTGGIYRPVHFQIRDTKF